MFSALTVGPEDKTHQGTQFLQPSELPTNYKKLQKITKN